MLPYDADSTNYSEILRAAASEISAKSGEAVEVFIGIQDQLEKVLNQLEEWESQREEFVDATHMDEYDNPEVLEDFDAADDSTVDDMYDAWDEFTAAEDVFAEDTTCIRELIFQLEHAISQIGVE